LKKGALFIVSHFSPHCSPEHEKIESYFLKENIIPAFDGMEALLGE
jgi:hypothetical protein